MSQALITGSKTCRFCREPMQQGASYCKECKHFESFWFSYIPYTTAFLALVTFIFSGGAYFYRTVCSPTWHFFSDSIDLTVVEACSHSATTIINSGDFPLLIRNITFECKDPVFSRSVIINRKLMPGEFGVYEAPPFEGNLVPYQSHQHFIDIVNRARELGHDSDLEPVFFTQNSSFLEPTMRTYGMVRVIDSSMTVKAYDLKNGKLIRIGPFHTGVIMAAMNDEIYKTIMEEERKAP